ALPLRHGIRVPIGRGLLSVFATLKNVYFAAPAVVLFVFDAVFETFDNISAMFSFCAFDEADRRFRSTFLTVPARFMARSCCVDFFAARLAASICFAVGLVAAVCILFSRLISASQRLGRLAARLC
ncbi:hypothetical protein JTF20_10875, partial [Streptococcus pneumoniae]|nr:hypothetical protein [Streptococcus pneumoniae]